MTIEEKEARPFNNAHVIIKHWSVHLMVTLKNSRNNANFFNIRIAEMSFNLTLITFIEFKNLLPNHIFL